MKNLNSSRYLFVFLLLLIFLSTTICLDKTLANNHDWIDISAGIEGGPSLTFCFEPGDFNILYAGVNGKGVYRITDSMQNWTLLNAGLDTVNSKVIYILKIDTVNSDTIFIGTKAGLEVQNNKWVVSNAFYKSTDRGKTWTLSNKGIIPKASYIASPPSVYDIAIDPNNHNSIFIATAEGIFKSVDGGNNWIWSGEGLGYTGASSILMNPKNPSILYTSSTLYGGLFK
jgi:hypothetical protein